MTCSKHDRKSSSFLRHQTGSDRSFYWQGPISSNFCTLLVGAELSMVEGALKACSCYNLVAMGGIRQQGHRWHGGGDEQSVFSQRLLQICCKTERYRRSFLPTAISIYNGSLKKPS
ncbi:hypothetical protein ILYODFUR_032378 [Ilyodon furcidens]|uniref:Uncharacterized protein n=1 Tax=Ilyodon furcidens TaxID=33524 RepID=A0ABV0V819_9TELE